MAALERSLRGDIAALERNLKGDVVALEGNLKGDMVALEGNLKGDMVALENRLVEVVRDVQSEILRGFERYAAAEQIKFRKLQADLSNVDASTDRRLEIVEQRLYEIEKKLLLRPPDAA
ncbi:MAG: hypothetical protein ABSH56_23930 [Bryobacteraceae bacterium]